MVIQKAIDNLKEKPKDDRKAVAAGIAFAVVVILFFGWAFLFLRKIQSGAVQGQLGGGAQDQFNFSAVRDAQQQLMQDYNGQTSNSAELQVVRQEAASRQDQQAVVQQQYDQSPTDQFGVPNTGQ